MAFEQLDQPFDRFDPRADAVGIKHDVRHFRRQVPGQNAGQARGRVDRERAMVDLIEAPLEHKHLHEIGIGEDRDGVVAGRQLYYGKP